MPLFPSAITWLRLTFRWSNSTQTWHERTGDLVLIGGVVAASAFTLLLNFYWWQIILVWALCLAPAAVLGRAGWLKIFGPVLYYDMVRQARRTRFAVMRGLYALLLIFLLFSVFSGSGSRYSSGSVDQAARIAETYFEVFMLAQFVTVLLLTPAYVAGAIAEEKDRKTLEFMLATDLLNREIVLSKLGSRVANLTLVVLTGLPILSILQFLGGVDPNLVVAGFVVTAMTIFGQAGLAVYCSVICKRPRDAISLAYMGVVMYYLVASLLLAVPALLMGTGALDSAVTTCVAILNKGNLFVLISAVTEAGYSGELATRLPVLVREYLLFHGGVALLCTGLAIARLRRTALMQSYAASAKSARWRIWKRPSVGVQPMLWKEVHCEGRSRKTWLGLLVLALMLAATFVPAGIIIWSKWEDAFREPVYRWDSLGEQMNYWVRTCNVIVGCLTLLAVAVRASTSITSERDKQTFDTLLTTPLESNAILFAKWVGSLVSARFGLLWMATIWALGVVTGGLHVVSFMLVVLAWLIYAGFAAALGLWFSAVCKTSLKATGLTIGAMITLGGLHWLPWMCCGFWMVSPGVVHLLWFHAGVLTPPAVLGIVPFSTQQSFNLTASGDKEFVELLGFCIVGMIVWGVATFILYCAASVRFKQITMRSPLVQRSRDQWLQDEQWDQSRRTAPPLSPWAPPTQKDEAESGIFDAEASKPDEDFEQPRHP